MELNFLKNLCFIIPVYVIVIFAMLIKTYFLVRENDNDEPYDEKKYIKLRAEKEQFKVMWVSLGAFGVVADNFEPVIRLWGVLVPIVLLGLYYRYLEKFCIRQELKKEERKLKEKNE
ncbi:hypothetical protein [Selenomonas ruminantium]|uniref:hypothetical protein n=1 Tax=Selenomonas ruminantium TaxID=971 RepID=UPI0026F07FB1|nr:hypothetical protein [Selenomonas ruminantium]